MTVTTVDDVPRLSGWVTSEETAAILGVTKQMVHRLIRNGKLKSTHRVGGIGGPVEREGNAKPVYIISETEVYGLKAERIADAELRAAKAS